jgi:hypothetical protein
VSAPAPSGIGAGEHGAFLGPIEPAGEAEYPYLVDDGRPS